MTEPIIGLDHVSKIYALRRTSFRGPHPELRAVRDVTLAIEAGRTVGVVGESGSGKSTLGRMALAMLQPTEGTVLIDGVDPSAVRGRERRMLRRKVQGIFQDPTSALNPRQSVGDSIAESLIVGGYRGAELRERTDALLELVGLDPRRSGDRPRQFSGGQRQRVVIARALAAEPSALIADEPVSALDVSVQAQVLNLFRDLQLGQNLASLFISHDLAVVAFVADTVVVMYLGEVVETGTVQDVLVAPAHPYTIALRDAARVGEQRTELPLRIADTTEALAHQGCVFRARCPIAMPVCETERPELVDIGAGRTAACHAL